MAIDTDILLVGAGPTGLYGAFCAGFRGLRAAVIDALPQLGGQIAALYPEKDVRDVAGIPRLRGRSLVDALVAQAASYPPTYLLGRQATQLQRLDDGRWQVGLSDGSAVVAGAIVITAGIGTFRPRPLPVGEVWLGRGLSYFVPDLSLHAGQRVVVAGGGDSALDWALAVAPVARSVRLVHRRAAFRAHAASLDAARAAGVEIEINTEIAGLHGSDRIESAALRTKGGIERTVAADAIIAALGFVSELGPLAGWGLTLRGRAIAVDQRMRTNAERIFAAGDVADYDGKVRLMSVGFGEVATAVNNAAVELDPDLSLFPGHSTEVG